MALNEKAAPEGGPGKIVYSKRLGSKDRRSVFQKNANDVLLGVYTRCEENQTIREQIDRDTKLKIILNSIIAKDRYDAPWFISSIMAEAHQAFNCDSIPDALKEMDARIDGLETINHEIIGMGYNALKDFKFVSTVYSMIMSELYTIKDIRENADHEIRTLTDQQQKDISYANEFLSKKSWPRIMTYVSTISASLGVTTAAFASNLKDIIGQIAGSSNVAMVLGTGAFVVSTALFATGHLIDFFVNRSIRKIMDTTDGKTRGIMRWEEGEVNKRLAFIRFKVIELEAKCRYLNDVKKEAPDIARAIDDGDWERINAWVDAAIQQDVSKAGGKPPFRRLADFVSNRMSIRARAEISGLDGNTTLRKQGAAEAGK
jgi:hypothetical protein